MTQDVNEHAAIIANQAKRIAALERAASRKPVTELVYHGTGTHLGDGSSPDNVNIDTEVVDTASIGSVGSNVLTIPAAGIYCIVAATSNTGGGGGNDTLLTASAGASMTALGTTFTLYTTVVSFYPAGATITIIFGYSGTPTLTFDFKLYRLA